MPARLSLLGVKVQALAVFVFEGHADFSPVGFLVVAVTDHVSHKVRSFAFHSLVLPKRHLGNTFDLTEAELVAIFDLARQVRALILMEDASVGNFNFAKNLSVISR
jgi:hypothetical protein